MLEHLQSRPLSVMRAATKSEVAQSDHAELFEMPGMPGFMVFHCAGLSADIAPSTCAKNYANPRHDACINCKLGERHHAQHTVPTEQPQPTRGNKTASASISKEVQDNLARRAALKRSGGQSSELPCIRCTRTSKTCGERYVGRFRLVRNKTICISCYNRERETCLGKNAKGGTPRKWTNLRHTTLVFHDGASVYIGATSGVDEAHRYAERTHPGRALADVQIGELCIATGRQAAVFDGPDLTGKQFGRLRVESRVAESRGRWNTVCSCGTRVQVTTGILTSGQRVSCGTHCTDRKRPKALPFAEQAETESQIIQANTAIPPPAPSAVSTETPLVAAPVTPSPRKLAVGARFGRLELMRDAGRQRWECFCDCGRKATMHTTALRGEREPSCGCLTREKHIEQHLVSPAPKTKGRRGRKPKPPMPGQAYGYLTALRPVRATLWRWQCTCGKQSTIDAAVVTGRKARHCGCGGRKAQSNTPAHPMSQAAYIGQL
jgi:hypothetical protein